MDRHDRRMDILVRAYVKALGIFACLLVAAIVFAVAINNSIGIGDDPEYMLENKTSCMEEELAERIELMSDLSEMMVLCAELPIEDTVMLTACSSFSAGSPVHVRDCDSSTTATRQLRRTITRRLPALRTACEADESCLAAAMKDGEPEWWHLDTQQPNN